MESGFGGRVVAITGGARGIGLATAAAFLDAGARVAIGDIDRSGAEAAGAELGRGTVGLELDVSDRESFTRFLDRVQDALGPIDVMVNNAGIQFVGPFADEDDALTERQIAVNLRGVMIGTKLAIARMRPRRVGHIVNVASAAGKVGTPGGATYSATKHAVVGLTESLRGELRGSGIGLSVVMPAIINTDMVAGISMARGIRPVEADAVGAAIVAAVEKDRFDVYVPGYTGPINKLMNVVPRRARDAINRAMRIDDVLMNIDATRRSVYEERLRLNGRGSDG